jgi:two-component system, NtrC family, response regulator AtoC
LRSLSLPQITGIGDLPVGLPQLIDEIPVGVLVLDLQRRVILLNRALEAMTGFDIREAYGIPCYYLLRSNLCPQVCPIKRIQDHPEPVSCDANIVNRSRQRIPVRVTAAPVIDSEGNLVAYIESIEDLRSQEPEYDEAEGFMFGRLIGRSPQILRVFRVLPFLAQTDSSVLITGQTGTGKDFVAEALHHASSRAKGPFIKVNCGALPETLLESELFGHQKGAFTGAVENKPGRFRLAHNGTLYLTEIGDLPVNLQVKLLSFLDDKVLHPLGSTKGIHVDVRVIAATHRNLEQMVKVDKFREDLLFRLNVVRIHLPPLVERGDDIKILLEHFLHTFNSKFKKKIRKFSEEAGKIVFHYRFPGNVRELKNIVEYSVNVCDVDQIQPHHLPAYLVEPEEEEDTQNGTTENNDFQTERLDKYLDMSWAEAERKMILEAMLKARGQKAKAAQILGWGRSTLWRKMKRYGIFN